MTRPLPDRLLCAPPDRRTRYLRLVLSVLAIAVLGLATTRLFNTTLRSQSELVLDYQSSVAGIIQVFYDVGNGIREANSSRADVQHTDHFQEVRLKFPTANLSWLRLDPLDRAGSMVLSHLRIARSGKPDIVLAPQTVSAVQQIASINISGDEIFIKTDKEANDPILRVTLDTPIKTFRRYDLHKVPAFIGWCVIWTALVWIVKWLSRSAAFRSPSRANTRRHRGLVIAAALGGTMMSCAPIIFLHQSLLAPSAGMFYNSCPTVPGQTDCRPEDVHMSDIGAMLWAFLPNVVVQEQAIKQSGEFPLWNRYNSAGVSMIGQGQMMLGDPLTWLQWLIGVDALSFDMKFVILRVVFAAALGLSVLTVTGSCTSVSGRRVRGAFRRILYLSGKPPCDLLTVLRAVDLARLVTANLWRSLLPANLVTCRVNGCQLACPEQRHHQGELYGSDYIEPCRCGPLCQREATHNQRQVLAISTDDVHQRSLLRHDQPADRRGVS